MTQRDSTAMSFFLPQAKDGINGVLVAEAGFASGRI